MFLENESQPIINHSSYDAARPMDHHHHNHLHHHHQTATNQMLVDHQDDSEGRSTASSPTSSYRELSGCEDFDLKIPKLTNAGSVTGSSSNNKEQKPKKHKCKHCGLECTEKVQYWKHIRTHIKPEQLLECPNCEFATDLKHHYEYHLLNHTGAKPFTCPDCDYKCVSKSMLQSHLKSHSNVFQFQCYDCGYASKYMHSLKQHLKKRDHRPATPLNPDGTPNPDIVIDVVGNRRGPRQNKKQNRHNPYHQPQHHQQQQPMIVSSSQDDGGTNGGPYSMQQLLQMPAPGIAPVVYPTSAESYMYSMLSKRMELADYQAEYLAIKNNNNNNNSTAVDDKMDVQQQYQHQQYTHHIMQYHPEDMIQVEVGGGGSGGGTPEPAAAEAPATVAVVETGPLNLSKDSVTPRAAGSSRRKGIACKLERPAAEQPKAPVTETVVVPMECTESKTTEVPRQQPIKQDLIQKQQQESIQKQQQQQQQQPIRQESVQPLQEQQPIRQELAQQQQPQQQQQQPSKPDELLLQQQHRSLSSPEKEDETHVCHHCDIIFKENIMYSMHMGFHSFRDPFACNLCGEITADKFSFFAHIARVPHS